MVSRTAEQADINQHCEKCDILYSRKYFSCPRCSIYDLYKKDHKALVEVYAGQILAALIMREDFFNESKQGRMRALAVKQARLLAKEVSDEN